MKRNTFPIITSHWRSVLRHKHIAQLDESWAADHQTISECRKLIWGNKNNKHMRTLDLQYLDHPQEELPLNHLPELQITITATAQQLYKGNIKKYLGMV